MDAGPVESGTAHGALMAGFSIPLAQLAEKIQADLNQVVRKSTVQVFGAVVLKSPVDQGRFRSNWNVSYGAPNVSTLEIKETGAITLGADGLLRGQPRAVDQVNGAMDLPVGGVVYLANSLPYARTLEYGGYPNPPKGGKGKTIGGFSKQAPAGMVRTSALEFDDYVKRVIAK